MVELVSVMINLFYKIKHMDQIIQQRQSVRDFWDSQAPVMIQISSIDRVYEHYTKWIKSENLQETCRKKDPGTKKLLDDQLIIVGPLPPINRYIFRTLIRKMGYKNSQGPVNV